jgi:hypothetical protein
MVADAAGMRNSGMKWDDIGAKYGVCGATVKQVIGSRGVRVQSFSRWGPRKEGSRYFSK